MIRGAEGRDPGAQGMAGGLGVFRQSSSRVILAGGNKMILRQSQILTQVWSLRTAVPGTKCSSLIVRFSESRCVSFLVCKMDLIPISYS